MIRSSAQLQPLGHRRSTFLPHRPTINRARFFGRGFTLVELIVVIVIMGIVSAAAVASMSRSRQNRQRAGARALAAGISFVRERALSTARPAWVNISTSTDTVTYSDTIGGVVVAIADPASGAQLSTVLGDNSDNAQFADTHITAVNGAVSGSPIIFGFDWQGRPMDSGGTLLSSDWTITIAQSAQSPITLTISKETGMVVIAW